MGAIEIKIEENFFENLLFNGAIFCKNNFE